MAQNNPKAPFLRKVREMQRFSRLALAERARVSAEAIQSLENGNPGRPRTIEALASALDALPTDLTGERSASFEAHEAYLDSLATEQKTYGPGDLLYDADPTLGRSAAEIAQFILENPTLRRRIEVLMEQSKKTRAALEAADEELMRIEAESREDAG